MVTDLVEFLRARYDEHEQIAKHAAEMTAYLGEPLESLQVISGEEYIHLTIDPAFVLAEVETKRAVLAETIEPFLHRRSEDYVGNNAWLAARLLALPYANHPDYREEWKP